jgi:hypothetical protein
MMVFPEDAADSKPSVPLKTSFSAASFDNMVKTM